MAHLRNLEREGVETEQKIRDLQSSKVMVEELVSGHAYLVALKERIALQQDQLMRVGNQLEEKRRILGDKTKAKKILEKLKERKLDEWTKEMHRIEANEIDEITATRYARQKNQES